MKLVPKNMAVWYERERVTDDVWRTVVIEQETIKNRQEKGDKQQEMGGVRKYVVTSAVLLLMMIASLSVNYRGTIAFFNDVEHSLANVIDAGLLDFDVVASAYEGVLTPGEGGGMLVDPVVSGVGGSFNLEYDVSAEYVSGDMAFCNAIHVFSSSGSLPADGPLLSLVGGPTSSVGVWELLLSLPDADGVDDGMTCVVDLVYEGRIDDLLSVQGYTDEERVRLTMTANISGEEQLFFSLQSFVADIPEETAPELPAGPEEEALPQENTTPEETTETSPEEETLEDTVPEEPPPTPEETATEETLPEEPTDTGDTTSTENTETVVTEETVEENTEESTTEPVPEPEPTPEPPPTDEEPLIETPPSE